MVTLEERAGYVGPCCVRRRERMEDACVRRCEGVGGLGFGLSRVGVKSVDVRRIERIGGRNW